MVVFRCPWPANHGSVEGTRHGHLRSVWCKVNPTDKWTAFFYPLLCALDMGDDGVPRSASTKQVEEGSKHSRTQWQQMTWCPSRGCMQRFKLKRTSAFCLIFGLEVTAQKLR